MISSTFERDHGGPQARSILECCPHGVRGASGADLRGRAASGSLDSATDAQIEGPGDDGDRARAQQRPSRSWSCGSSRASTIASRLANEAAQRESAARKEVLAVVSHDLRNPLSAIVMGASLLNETLPEMGPGPRRQLGVIRKCGRSNDAHDRRVARCRADRCRLRSAFIGTPPMPPSSSTMPLQLFHARAEDQAILRASRTSGRQDPKGVGRSRARAADPFESDLQCPACSLPEGGEIVGDRGRLDGASVRFSIRGTPVRGSHPSKHKDLFEPRKCRRGKTRPAVSASACTSASSWSRRKTERSGSTTRPAAARGFTFTLPMRRS